MNLQQLQHDAWHIAEQKGLHDSLKAPGPREEALAHLVWVFGCLTEIAQRIKRLGTPASAIEWQGFETSINTVVNELLDWQDCVKGSDNIGTLKRFLPMPPAQLDALVRLTLIHTEVSEASEQASRLGDDAGIPDLLGDELADIMTRVADLAETLGIDLDIKCVNTLARNRQRPYKYGTPDEGKHGTPNEKRDE